MRRARFRLFAAVYIVGLALVARPAAAQPSRPIAAGPVARENRASSCHRLCVAKDPRPSTSSEELIGASSLGGSDVWAVGYFFDPITAIRETLIEHYNGSSWSVTSSPSPGLDNQLFGVSGSGSDDVWAVGVTSNGSSSSDLLTLIEHWDGVRWRIVGSPSPGDGAQLNAVVALSPTDVWAAGLFYGSTTVKTLVLHYDGSSWTRTLAPSPGGGALLNGIAAGSSGSIWAVGERFRSDGTGRSLALHYDGTSWTRQASPNSGHQENQIKSVTAVSATEAWAVGSRFYSVPLIWHFTGGQWSILPAPVPEGLAPDLESIAAGSATDIWAVGGYFTNDNVGHTLAEHFDGSTWTIVPSADSSPTFNSLRAVASVSQEDVWAVGNHAPLSIGGPELPLGEHFDGMAWSAVTMANADVGRALFAIHGSAADDVWAVGTTGNRATGTQRAFAEHFDGTGWSIVHTRRPGVGSLLSDVSALSHTDAWAVGSYLTQNLDTRTLIEHWDGTSWSVAPSPNPGSSSGYSVLSGVMAVGSSDIWAIGSYVPPAQLFPVTLVEHYDGTQWRVVSSPSGAALSGVDASGTDDVWAVGASGGPLTDTLVEHYDGSSWTVVSSPSPGDRMNTLYSVVVLSASQAWAVGNADYFLGGASALIERYDGTSWKKVAPAALSSATSELIGLSGLSGSGLWAVGDVGDKRGFTKTLIEHYDGTAWTRSASPNGGSRINVLADVFEASATDAWAVGYDLGDGGAAQPLIEHYDGSGWTKFPNP